MAEKFEPRIVGFLCNWCSYAGADLAGVSRIQYPPNVRVVRVMCSGRVDPVIVVECLLKGLDGVLICGCHPGDCHYTVGNYQAEHRMNLLGELLKGTEFAGRVKLEWVSASEGARFGDVVRNFVQELSSLGPNPIKTNPELGKKLLPVKDTMGSARLRNIIGKYDHLLEKENVYGEKTAKEELDRVFKEVADSEFIRARIYNLVLDTPLSVLEISKLTGIKTDKILRHVVVMRRKNLLALSKIEGQSPKYVALKVG